MNMLLGILLALTAIFLILLVLVQRGRGGGLSGALGGMGGQSAFGAKAGDVFTRVTIGTALFWILLCVASVKLLGGSSDKLSENMGESVPAPDGGMMTRPLGVPDETDAAAEAPAASDTGAPATESATPPAGSSQTPAEAPSPPSSG
jgi:preprotein translocase subunit SecG